MIKKKAFTKGKENKKDTFQIQLSMVGRKSSKRRGYD